MNIVNLKLLETEIATTETTLTYFVKVKIVERSKWNVGINIFSTF